MCPAISRWVKFDANADTYTTIASSNTISGTGTPGYVEGQSVVSGLVTIVSSSSDQLQVAVNGGSLQQITLTSGANLDARMVAREMTFKLKQIADAAFDGLTVDFINNKFRITSSSLGATSQISIDNGTNDCLHKLGLASSQGGPLTIDSVPGTSGSNNAGYTGQVVVSGVYKGQFDDIYTVMVGTSHPVSGTVAGGSNVYVGTCTAGGDWNESTDESYTITMSTTNGATMDNGAGNVPTITWTSTQGDNNSTPIEVLYSNHWYNIGTKGLRVKFSDAPFGSGDTFTVNCVAIVYAQGSNVAAAVGSAQYVWSSLREGKSTSATTSQVTGTAVGTKGVTISFSNSGVLTRRDEFRIICSGPQPTTLGVTVLNFGSVTVSTYSPTQVVWFELLSGATVLATPKFGLNSHGTAQHHNQGNSDTKFAFGTAGEGNPASDGSQWKKGIVGNTDLASDVPPAYLYATQDNMPIVSTADQSIAMGTAPGEMVTDFIYLAIKLGSLEVGANSSIVWRMYFDYS